MSKTITRKYISKKTGQLVVKTYTYHKTYKGPRKVATGLIYTKAGKLNLNNLNKLLQGKTITEQSKIKSAILGFKQSDKYGKVNLKVSTVIATAIDSHVAFIINSGYTLEEAALEISVKYNVSIDTEYLLDKNHWTQVPTKSGETRVSRQLILPDGQLVNLDWTYEGSIIV